MREIKFRAWIDNGDGDTHMVYQGEPDVEDLHSFMFFWGEAELMQYTGLKDKKGKEIYEGDIVKDLGGRVTEVFWNSLGSGSWWFKEEDIHVKQINLTELEVIGNIHENPTGDR